MELREKRIGGGDLGSVESWRVTDHKRDSSRVSCQVYNRQAEKEGMQHAG